MPIELPPVLAMWLGLIILPLLPRSWRPTAFLAFPLAALFLVLTLPVGTKLTMPFAHYELVVLQVTELNRAFGFIFSLIALLGGVYSLHMRETGQQGASLLYAGGGLGVVYCGDFFTMLVCWELMAAGSAYLIWSRRTRQAQEAGMRYLLLHLLGGSLLLAGIIIHAQQTGSLLLTSFSPGESFAAWIILTGVAVNAAFIPLHAWLPDSYPRSTVTGSVFLSAFTTKAAVYVLAALFPGWPLLLYMGVAMTLYGVTFAFLANDIREILSYHIMSQVGYMVAAIGIGTEFGINGATAHAFNNLLYKPLLFMCTGAVLYATGTSKLNQLGALASKMRWVLVLYMVAAFSISGLPLTNGFVSKSLIYSAAGEGHFYTAKFLLILASVGTFLSVGIKLPYYTWFHEKKADHVLKPIPKGMMAAMAATAFFCIFYGLPPMFGMTQSLLAQLPYAIVYNPFTIPQLVEAIQVIIFTFLAFWIVREKLTPKDKISLDVDWFYRTTAPAFRTVFIRWVNVFFETVERKAFDFAHYVTRMSANPIELMRAWQTPKRDFDADRHRPPLAVPMLLTLLATVFVIAWSYWI